MKKRRRRAGSHGAVSVFLAIILVPCMVFTCVFTDLGRVHLSRAVSESAADLALYSLLSHYDENLKEYYGLVSSCQTIEEFYDDTETYFAGMLRAEGVPEEGSQLFLEYLRELQDEGYSDFLQVELSGIEVDAVKNSALNDDAVLGNNPALIEDGIVEFMKYRGPISLTTRLLDRFASLNLDSSMDTVNKDKEVSDAKQVYAQAQGDLLKLAFYSYLAIREYDKAREASGIPTGSMYAGLAQELSDIRDDLRAVTSLVTKYYYPGTENIGTVEIPFFSTADYHYDVEDVGEKEEQADGTVTYCLDNGLLEELMEDLDEDLKEIGDAAGLFLSKCTEIPAPVTGINYVVYCMAMQQAIDDSNVIAVMNEKGDAILKTYAKLDAAAECEPQEDLPADWEQRIEQAQEKIDEAYNAYLNRDGDSDYLTRVKDYERTAEETVPKVQERSFSFTSKYTGKNETAGSFSSAVSGMLLRVASSLSEEIELLNTAIDGGTLANGSEVPSLDELRDAAAAFRTSRTDWGSKASAYKDSSDYASDEYELYAGAEKTAETGNANGKETEGEAIAARITDESVTELKNRLVHIRTEMQGCLDAVNAFAYGGTCVKDLTDAAALIQAARTVVPANSSYALSDAESAAGSYFQTLMVPAQGAVYTAPARDSAADGNDPDLNHAMPVLYQYMKEQLKEDEESVENALKENDEREERYKEQQDNEKKMAQGVDNQYLANKGTDIVDFHEGKSVSLLSSLESIVSIAHNVLNGTADELRDQLYVCEYIMDMFSYSSFDNEGKYRLELEGYGDREGNENVSWKDFPYEEQKEAWEKEDARDVMGNQSLTNLPIVKENHHANLGEVEYILYGDPSLDKNLESSYKDIFAIREMLNLVSGFCNFYGDSTLTKIAFLVARITCGIVPIPVTKCVILLVLATLESAKDLQRLKAGGRVELYKSTADDWVYRIDVGSNLAASFSERGSSDQESGLYYSDYMYIFLLIGLSNEDTYSSMLLRVGDLIQANMRLLLDDKSYSLAKARSYFTLTGTVRVKPLMLTLPIVDTVEGAKDLRTSTDWCTYQIEIARGYS